MKTKNIKLLTVFTLLLMAGCTEDALDEGRGQMPISLTATVECDSDAVYTRAGTGVLNSFANGDAIKVYFPSDVRVGSTTSASSTTYSYNGSSWSPATQPYFNAGTSNCTVHAYYPSSHTNSTSSFSVQQDQSGDAQYKASDLMYATATITKSSPSGSLTFSHRMAKIIVNATAGAGVSTIIGVRIIGGYRTINISTPQSCALGTTLSNALSTSSYITMYSGGSSGSASCAAMIPPQSISGSFLQVVTNQGTATYSLASAKSFASGKSYQLNITVNAAAVGTTNSIPSWTGAGDVSVNASPWTVAVSGTCAYNNGSAIVPAADNITVTPVGGGLAISSSKYSVYCENNTNIGTAKLLVYGKDEHFGKFAETTFTIGKGAGSISYATTNVQMSLSDATFTNTLTNSGDGVVTSYSSSNTSVATVNSSTGQVTIAGAGSATITATVADGLNYTYATKTCSYTLEVSSQPQVGMMYFTNGTYGNTKGNKTVAGIIVYVDQSGTDDDALTEKSSGFGHALVMALSDVSGTQNWGPTSTDEDFLTNSTTLSDCQSNNKSGLSNTASLIGDAHTHNAASSARSFSSPAAPESKGSSKWFLPSAAQWYAVFASPGLGGLSAGSLTFKSYFDSSQTSFNAINSALTKSGVGGTALINNSYYWSSSEYDSSRAVRVQFNSSRGIYVYDFNKSSGSSRVRAFLAF